MKSLTSYLDFSLLSNCEINSDYSGWYFLNSSEILIVFIETTLYFANLGDTRAVLSTTSHDNSYGKNSVLSQQLTNEHRPEYTQEFERISKAGGRVQKLLDLQGNQIGPYRIWEPERNFPGLTISRCIGADLCKSLGVTAVPDTFEYKVNEKKDFFLVIASDGIWDVMANQEVINFIEAYREKCVKGIDICPNEEIVNFSNTCIAHLLGEEARSRWILRIEDENMVTDDITCVVFELKQGKFETNVVSDVEVRNTNLESSIERKTHKAPTLIDRHEGRSRKSTLIGVSILNSKTEMQ